MATQQPRFGGGLTGDPSTSVLGGLTGDPRTNIFGFGNQRFNPPQPRVEDLGKPPGRGSGRPSATGLSRDVAENPINTAIDLPSLDIDRPEYLGDWRDQVSTFYQNRMDPSYTSFSPEARRALDRDIGRRHETTRQAISTDLRGRGLGGSGIEAQLRSDAAGFASAQAGDVAADISMYDESQRAAAAQSLESLYRFGTGDAQLRERLVQELGLASGETQRLLSQGPPIVYEDLMEIFGTDEAYREFEREMEIRLEELARTGGDLLEFASGLPPAIQEGLFAVIQGWIPGK